LKCLTEGKPVIIEGVTLIPDMYIADLAPDPPEDDVASLETIMSYVNNEIKLKKT